MKKVFSIIAALMFFSGAVVFAFNVQDDPICSQPEHVGYTYTGEGETPPLPFDPLNPPAEVQSMGKYVDAFVCDGSPNFCHWAYDEDQERWVPCENGNPIPTQ